MRIEQSEPLRVSVCSVVGLAALAIALLLTPSARAGSGVVFNEIMYHPATNEAAFEWIELHNQFAYDLDISGWRLRGGVEYDVPNGILVPAHGFRVIALSPNEVAASHGLTNVLGPFEGRLGNAGEELRLRNNSGRLMDVVDYGDAGEWPVAPDGSGVSLCKAAPYAAGTDPASWTWSANAGGTPGAPNATAVRTGLTINETPSALTNSFWVELVNVGTQPLALTHHVLALAGSATSRYVFTSETIASGEMLVVTEAMLGAHPVPGDKLFLSATGQVIDAASVDDRLRGRYPDGTGEWAAPSAPTPGQTNRFAFHTEVVINEIMYGPAPRLDPYEESGASWIELHNRGTGEVDLTGWRLSDGVEFDFPDGTLLAPGGFLVVADSTNAVRAVYPAVTNLVGDYRGNLSRAGERIELRDAAGNTADAVHYYDCKPWPYEADGYGPSLELRDPRADNSRPEAWAASDEGSRTAWRTYAYTNRAAASPVGPDGQWQEFVLGLLQAGEVLLDDVSVIADPEGAATELVQNGTFESDTAGSQPAAWRIIGNHRHSEVVVDPDAPGNKALRLKATGPTEHLHNHSETTLAGGAAVQNGTPYRISYRAKWVAGSRQINTRLYFNRCARTTVLDIIPAGGTPGTANSQRAGNIGPTCSGLHHDPTVPDAGETVTVSVHAEDPDGVSAITNWYAVEGGAWTGVPMTPRGGGLYEAQIPGQAARDVVQFYVSGSDAAGMVSTYPPGGPDSRALYRVQDGHAATNGLDNVRIVMTENDYDFMLTEIERMSNERLGATVIFNENKVFYDVGVRLKGSGYGRNDLDRAEFMLRFNADALLYGTHRDVALDRSQSGFVGQREMLAYIFMNRAGGPFSRYSNLVKCIAPRDLQTSASELRLDRLDEEFLNSLFEGGDQGLLYEYELVYYPRTTVDGDPQSRKKRADRVQGTRIRNLGDSKEDYRWNFLLKNNRVRDDFGMLMAASRVYDATNTGFLAQIDTVLDVDTWMRTFALAIADGHGDSFASGHLPHNAFLYVRPEDGRLLYFPHDMDHAWRVEETLVPNQDLARFLDAPAFERLYLGHMLDVLQTAYNPGYMSHWTAQLGALLPAQDFASYRDFIETRSAFLMTELLNRAPPQTAFTLYGPTSVDTESAHISGTAWVDLYEIRVDGLPDPLQLTWQRVTGTGADEYRWSADVPLNPGTNELVFTAVDFQGRALGTIVRNILSTAGGNALERGLRVSEVMYAPPGGSGHEFVELVNVGTNTLDIAALELTDGIAFTFADGPYPALPPDQHLVVVRDLAAFAALYDTNGMWIAGSYSGKLDNDGERFRLQGPLGRVLVDFTYADGRGWPEAVDGAGHSLVPRDLLPSQGEKRLDHPMAWRASAYRGGSPGARDPVVTPSVVINEFAAHTDYSGGAPWQDSNDWIELFNAAATTIVFDAHWYLSDDGDELTRWNLPAGPLGPGQWVTFTEVDHFHPSIDSGFGLNKSGESVFLSHLPGTPADRVIDSIHFRGQESGVTEGRYPDGAGAWFKLAPTTNAANALPTAHVVIDEVMYHPVLDDAGLEFVELLNASSVSVPLSRAQALPWDPDWTETWRVDGGIAYSFPTGIVLGAGERVVLVAFDPADAVSRQAFLSRYGLSEGQVRLLGPYSGRLANGSERVALEAPEAPDVAGGDTAWVIVDEVIYDDNPPWPKTADGGGRPLQRHPLPGTGLDADNWAAGLAPTPGGGGAKVALVNPTDGAQFVAPCTVVLEADVDARFVNGSVHQLAFRAGAQTVATVSNAPYRASFPCTGAATQLTVTAILTDDAGDAFSPPATILVYTNRPTVSVTSSRVLNATLYNTLALSAHLSLNGLPSNLVTTSWHQLDGPDTVLLANPDRLGTTALFPSPGSYTLAFVSLYGGHAGTNLVTVSVLGANAPNAVPYAESFEVYDEGRRIDGTRGWYPLTASVAEMDTGSHRTGEVPLPAEQHERAVHIYGTVDNLLTNTAALGELWVDTLIECIFRPTPWEAPPRDDYQFAFYFASNGQMNVWHGDSGGDTWTALPAATVTNGQWARVTIRTDATGGTNRFGLWLDGTRVTQPLNGFSAAGSAHAPLRAVRAQGTYRIDDLVVEDYNVLDFRKITATAGMHGNVAPSGDVLVPLGSGTSITATGTSYFHVASVTVDGEPAVVAPAPVIVHTFTNVLSRHSFDAAFAENLATNSTPEWWLASFGWTNDFNHFAVLDLDGDGAPAWAEFAAGTVPTNPASVLAITQLLREHDGVVLSWPGVSGRVYNVYRSAGRIVDVPRSVLTNDMPATAGDQNTFKDGDPPSAPAFYRIGVRRP